MKCYECDVEVVPQSYPEGECPQCGLTYTLSDDSWKMCNVCGDPPASDALDGKCVDCYLEGEDE